MPLSLQRYFGYTRILATGAPAPRATVTIYQPVGTPTLATIYANEAGDPKSNPFTADVSGFFYFYAPPGEYDVRTSTGLDGIIIPYTWGDVSIPISATDVEAIVTDLQAQIDVLDAEAVTFDTRLDRLEYRNFNVRDYGALGNFVHNDTAAFAACIAAAKAAQGNVYVPGGLYINTATIDLSTNGTNMTFYGQSRDISQLIMATVVSGTVSVANGSKVITGSGTAFSSQFAAGDGVIIGGIMTGIIDFITDNTHMSMLDASAPSASGQTYYKCGIAGSPSMTIGSQSYIQLKDFTMKGDCTGRNTAVTQVNGTNAILWSGVVGVCADIENVELVGFADHGMYVRGPTAPTTIRCCAISLCSGYGVIITDVTGQSPQDVTIEQTSIHRCFGGVRCDGCSSVDLIDLDIELSGFATRPCVQVTTGVFGNDAHSIDITNCSLSLEGTPTPAAVVYIDGFGCTIRGGRSEVNGTTAATNIDIRNQHNVVIGGLYANNATGTGYFCTTTGSLLFNTVISPRLLANYAANRDLVFDTTFPGARTTAIGVNSRAGNGTSLLDNVAINNTVAASVATPSTHKVTVNIGGVTYYLLATT